MRILLGHSFSDLPAFGAKWIETWLARLVTAGFHVDPFSLVIDQNRPVIYFRELNILWRHRDKRLLAMYNRLASKLEDYDAFICFNGSNVHPDFVSTLKCKSVYACFDDPEASDKLSRPVAGAFDLAMVGNIAELQAYKSWGVRKVNWWPLGFRQDDFDASLSEKAILHGPREVDITLLCERVTRYRKHRVDQFVTAFPNGAYYGRGWPAGFLPESERIPLLQRTRIGINIHNSTGPINFRTFYLPANGVLQICDNKKTLGLVFALDKEVLGYDTIEEAIEIAHYYVMHDEERRSIAAAGWRRALADYNEVACFQRVVDAINELEGTKEATASGGVLELLSPRSSLLGRIGDKFALRIWVTWVALRSYARSVVKRMIYGV